MATTPANGTLTTALRAAYDRINRIDAVGLHGDILRRDALRVIIELAHAHGVEVGTTQPTAVALPDRSIVATTDRVFIKRIHGVGTPAFESYWLAAESYAIGLPSSEIQTLLDTGAGRVMRIGDGQ